MFSLICGVYGENGHEMKREGTLGYVEGGKGECRGWIRKVNSRVDKKG
jgi:hypothetical protein